MSRNLLQNFRGARALIVASGEGGIDTLESVLGKLGLVVARADVPEAGRHLDLALVEERADLLFIDGDLDSVLPCDLGAARTPPVPVIGLVGIEAPGRLKALMNQGATAFLRKPVYAGAVYTTLFLGVNQYLLRKEMASELNAQQDRRRRRKAVIKTILLLMEEHHVDDDEAYVMLRRDSMRRRQSLEDYCEDYISGRSKLTASSPEAEPRTAARR
ncbi:MULTISPECIES: ANTAR domain-containing response regulator [Xanthobacter]|uniref:ANTAR domain-containing response regulator n=1 Tax=Xanthobacter TaxID=279 RepID=UPI001E3D8354|nr:MULTISPECIES: ANTAR domain-containing protein [Xanthobacter]UDQ87467.1 ANTAR domain-containing protein [Xanthobacter autotrophicus]UJX46791.1 ANTAR domain-containing protein [Xanthobacter sp. YC-JY1]